MQKNYVDQTLFKELAELDPDDVCRRAQCSYDPISRGYTLSVWDDDYVICPNESKIERITNNLPSPHEYLYVFIINFLLKARETDIINEWISEKDIPGGTTFFRGPHKIPTKQISERFQGNIDGFSSVCGRLLNGTPLGMADAAYIFQITERVPIAVLFWDGDDEFPPEAKILYDRSMIDHFALDIIYALAVDVCYRIGSTSV